MSRKGQVEGLAWGIGLVYSIIRIKFSQKMFLFIDENMRLCFYMMFPNLNSFFALPTANAMNIARLVWKTPRTCEMDQMWNKQMERYQWKDYLFTLLVKQWGVKKCPNFCDVIYEWSLTSLFRPSEKFGTHSTIFGIFRLKFFDKSFSAKVLTIST